MEEALDDVQWGEPTVYSEHGISHRRSVASADNVLAISIGVEPPIHATFWARVEAGGFIVPHIDAGLWWERWHFPVLTGGTFWEDGNYFSPVKPFVVHHWVPHAVFNDSAATRVHLIVDRAVRPENAPGYMSLQVTEMIPEVAQLIPE